MLRSRSFRGRVTRTAAAGPARRLCPGGSGSVPATSRTRTERNRCGRGSCRRLPTAGDARDSVLHRDLPACPPAPALRDAADTARTFRCGVSLPHQRDRDASSVPCGRSDGSAHPARCGHERPPRSAPSPGPTSSLTAGRHLLLGAGQPAGGAARQSPGLWKPRLGADWLF